MELVEVMCDSCHELFEIDEKNYDDTERQLCLDCETAIKED